MIQPLVRVVGSGLVAPLAVGSLVTLLVVATSAVGLAAFIVVLVVGLLVGTWLCVFHG